MWLNVSDRGGECTALRAGRLVPNATELEFRIQPFDGDIGPGTYRIDPLDRTVPSDAGSLVGLGEGDFVRHDAQCAPIACDSVTGCSGRVTLTIETLSDARVGSARVFLYDRRLDTYELLLNENESPELALARIGLAMRPGVARFRTAARDDERSGCRARGDP